MRHSVDAQDFYLKSSDAICRWVEGHALWQKLESLTLKTNDTVLKFLPKVSFSQIKTSAYEVDIILKKKNEFHFCYSFVLTCCIRL